jgi:glycosyltransferase involved in cell wall biosynthesis
MMLPKNQNNDVLSTVSSDPVIGIDIRKINDFGIGIYIRNLLKGLKLSENSGCLTHQLFTDKQHLELPVELSGQHVKTVELPRNRRSPFQGKLPESSGLSLFHAPHYLAPDCKPVPLILTVHDCIHLNPPEIPETFLMSASFYKSALARAKRRYHRWQGSGKFKHSVHSASEIITVSEFTAKQLTELLNVKRDRITVVYNCADDIFFKQTDDQENRNFCYHYNLPYKDYVLYCGNDLYHKNLPSLMIAWKHLKEKIDPPMLVLAGPSRTQMIRSIAKKLEIFNLITITQHLPFNQMPLLYKSSLGLVNPSLAEGFGLPVIEAMISGIPVACSNLDVFREVTSDNAIFFDPEKPEDICDAILCILSRPAGLDHQQNRAAAFAKRYSLNAFISGHKHVYNHALGGI